MAKMEELADRLIIKLAANEPVTLNFSRRLPPDDLNQLKKILRAQYQLAGGKELIFIEAEGRLEIQPVRD